jgi:hypothetical protein
VKRGLVVLAAALLLTGCAGDGARYPAATAGALQDQVLAVTQAAADGDLDAAVTRLEELIASTKDARARGNVTADREDSILAAIELVRGDLEALVKKAADKEKEPAEEPATGTGTGTGTGTDDSGSVDSDTGGGTDETGDEENSGEGSSNENSGEGDEGAEETAPPEEPVEENDEPADPENPDETDEEEPTDGEEEQPAPEEPVTPKPRSTTPPAGSGQ